MLDIKHYKDNYMGKPQFDRSSRATQDVRVESRHGPLIGLFKELVSYMGNLG